MGPSGLGGRVSGGPGLMKVQNPDIIVTLNPKPLYYSKPCVSHCGVCSSLNGVARSAAALEGVGGGGGWGFLVRYGQSFGVVRWLGPRRQRVDCSLKAVEPLTPYPPTPSIETGAFQHRALGWWVIQV